MTQMRNQNPLEPLKDTDFISQVSQLSSLDSMQQLNSNINAMLTLQQVTQGANLIGKKITYDVSGKTLPQSGVVSAVQVSNGQVQLVVGKQSVALGQLKTIESAPGN